MPPLTEANFAARIGRVSASEVGALMPELHPYMDARDIWDRLHGLRDVTEPTEAMRLGSILEPAILEAAAERFGWRVRANGLTMLHRTLPLCATPDAHILGTRSLCEVKFTGNPAAWANGLPSYVWYQAQAQLMCDTGYERVEVVVLAGGLRHFMVERSNTAARRIGRAVRALTSGPAPDHIVRDRSIINTYSGDVPESIAKGARS
jgi:hypothetical protein